LLVESGVRFTIITEPEAIAKYETSKKGLCGKDAVLKAGDILEIKAGR
jgi:hypothetical protein